MNKLTIKQQINESLKILYNHLTSDEEYDVTINKDDLIFLANTIKTLIDCTDTFDVCEFCFQTCLTRAYGKQICCESYHGNWTYGNLKEMYSIKNKFIKDRLELLNQLKNTLYSEFHELEYYAGKTPSQAWGTIDMIYKLAKEALEAQLNNK